MPRTKQKAKDNQVINGLFIISESFKRAGVSDDDLLDTLHSIDFVHYFDNVRDFRNVDMITYKLSDLLMMAFLTILANGVNSFWGIADHVRICHEKYEKYGLLKDGHYPSHDTFRRVFSLISPQNLYEQTVQVFYDFLQSLEDLASGRTTYKQWMFDGKEVRGSGRREDCKNPKKNANVMNVYDSSLQTCIHSEVIPDKTNEIPTIQDFLRGLNLKNVILTADALHCQKETASIIAEKKGIYVFPVKDNQKLLHGEIIALLGKSSAKTQKIEMGKRRFEALMLPKRYACDGFTGMKMFIKMESVAHSEKKPTTMYFITNGKDANVVCQAIANRWDIENGLHKEKDTFLNEDRFRSAEKNTINCLAIMNNFAMQIVRIYQSISGLELREAKIYVRNYPMETFQKIASIMGSEKAKAKIATEMKKIKKLRLN